MKKWPIAMLGIAVVLAAGAYSLRSMRVKASQPCWNKLMNIESAKEQWAVDNRAKSGIPVTMDNILPYLRETPV